MKLRLNNALNIVRTLNNYCIYLGAGCYINPEYLSNEINIQTARQFFTQEIERRQAPEKITAGGYEATHTAIDELKESAILPMYVPV
jgi:hypothetical protein